MKGKVQIRLYATTTNKEKYYVISFRGVFGFFKALWIGYRKYKPDCIYIFFDKNKQNETVNPG